MCILYMYEVKTLRYHIMRSNRQKKFYDYCKCLGKQRLKMKYWKAVNATQRCQIHVIVPAVGIFAVYSQLFTAYMQFTWEFTNPDFRSQIYLCPILPSTCCSAYYYKTFYRAAISKKVWLPDCIYESFGNVKPSS